MSKLTTYSLYSTYHIQLGNSGPLGKVFDALSNSLVAQYIHSVEVNVKGLQNLHCGVGKSALREKLAPFHEEKDGMIINQFLDTLHGGFRRLLKKIVRHERHSFWTHDRWLSRGNIFIYKSVTLSCKGCNSQRTRTVYHENCTGHCGRLCRYIHEETNKCFFCQRWISMDLNGRNVNVVVVRGVQRRGFGPGGSGSGTNGMAIWYEYSYNESLVR